MSLRVRGTSRRQKRVFWLNSGFSLHCCCHDCRSQIALLQLYMYLLVSLLSLVVVLHGAATPEKRCGSVDIRNSPRMAFQPKQSTDKSMPNALLYYKECTILEGDFTISMITSSNVTNEEYPVFEKLREVTGSILVFQIKGLLSLGRMFPNLRVIGGHSLIMNYALVVYQNNDLREIGLTKLMAIKNGGVRITENPRLCYSQSINWDKILMGKVRDQIIDQVAGQCKNECQVEDESDCLKDESTGSLRCWSPQACQTFCEAEKYPGSGCTDDGNACHEYCLGGCSLPNNPTACHSCRKFDVNETCVDKCPVHLYEQLGRRCLSRKECHNLTAVSSNPGTGEKSDWKAFNKQCHYDCPNSYQEDPDNSHNCIECSGYCPKKCAGDTVDSIGSAMKFSKCNAIEGNLELDMRIGMESTSAEKFTEAFGEIEEISGYLLVRFSSAFMSLHMFKKLRVIHGQQLWKNMYSLVVFENQNLNQLFNLENRKMQILNGKVTFQNNRMLCYKRIEAFLDHVGLNEKVTENDVSSFSNGDKAICDEIPLTAKIVQIYNYGFLVGWLPFNTTDMDHRKFLGYQIFYKKVDKIDPNMTIDDDRSACSDSWNMHFVTDGGDIDNFGEIMPDGSIVKSAKGELINTGVESNTLYAVYVQTRLVNHPGAKNAISKILFVTTYFAPPDPARMKKAYALGPDSVAVEWDCPLNEYGLITHYMITWNLVNDADSTALAQTSNVCTRQRNIPQIMNSASSLSSETVSVSSLNSQETCSKEEGCCKCSNVNSNEHVGNNVDSPRSLEEKRGETDNFEDAMQNKVFVQKDQPSKRKNISSSVTKQRRAVRQYAQHSALRSAVQDRFNKDNASVEQPPKVIHHDLEELNVSAAGPWDSSYNVSSGRINITGTHLILTGLPHYAEYQMTIYACQDTSVPEYYCSARPLWTTVRTDPIMEYDMIDPETVVVYNVTDNKSNDKRVYWLPPKNPNGYVLSYRVKLIRDDGLNSISHAWSKDLCKSFNDFEKDNGFLFLDLLDGHYSLEVRLETSTSLFNNATLIKDIFVLYTPGFFTLWRIVILCAILTVLIIVAGTGIYYLGKRISDKKVKEYWRQTISANPEYLSQMDIYKADEWELKRDDLVLEAEIGRGTFGKVYRGYAKNITSITGEVFGECAVKTVPEGADNAERLHFLVEASVMKQFNTAFIVKLYGVVSDGQPVLVVMELMDKGNLRDFLRSHRPNAEENKDNREVPNLSQYFTWAAQIADGMSYLESLKFCHRDLAARNCMVHADESVKIGDFGMARDIYYHEYYKPAGKRLMPVRWMAPESLKDGKFTMKSDVWSFGIVMYEMLTLGQQPYAGLANEKVFNFIGVQRHVLRKPTGCPDYWYKLMRTCWRYDPRERPTFHHIVKHLNKHVISQEFRKVSYVMNNLQNWSPQDQYFDFDIDIEVQDDPNNIYNDDFGYIQEDEDDLDDCTSHDREVYASEEDFPMISTLNNNRRPNGTLTIDAEGLLTDLTPRQEINSEQNLMENTL